MDAFRLMLEARLLDEKQLILHKQGKVHAVVTCTGHEAAQVAAALALRPGIDWAFPYYRDLAFVHALGVSLRDLFLASLHRAGDPASAGRQPPSHFGHRDLRIVTQSPVTGSQYLQAVGVALGAKREHRDEVVYVSSGEGATSQGEFYEAINWASREQLPVIFFVQDNGYAISVPVRQQTAGGSIHEAFRSFPGLHSVKVDGTDLPATYAAMTRAVARAQAGHGPTLLVAEVVRFTPHSASDDHSKYRTLPDIERDRARDPLPRLRALLIQQAMTTEERADELAEEAKKAVDAAATWAELQPLPSPESVVHHVYGQVHAARPACHDEPVHTGNRILMVDAINHALAEEMAVQPKMILFGEDVADGKGGVFGVTRGLSSRYGDERVFNTQLAEASILGAAIGLAVRGWRPVPEIQFGDYLWPAFLQLRNELAMIRYRSAGQWSCPVVIRVPVGGGVHGGHYHSQCIEGIVAHIPGIRLVFPSNAADAKGLLKAALRGDDPVLFMEHKGLYRQPHAASPEPAEDWVLPLGLAAVRREGSDVTLVTYGAMVERSLEAARIAAERGISVEVIDLRTLNPLDEACIYASVRKTGKVIIVHEDTLTGGFGAELAARIGGELFDALDGPIVRVAALDTPVPYSPPLEQAMLPNERKVLEQIERLARY